jgi:phosphatidylserine decarboxylase
MASNDPPASETHPHAIRLKSVIERSSATPDVTQSIHSHIPFVGKLKWIPGIEKLAAKYHWGNFVAIRGTNDRIFESMPIYARSVKPAFSSTLHSSDRYHRIGMHLLFYGKEEREAVHLKSIERLLQEESSKVGLPSIVQSTKLTWIVPARCRLR